VKKRILQPDQFANTQAGPELRAIRRLVESYRPMGNLVHALEIRTVTFTNEAGEGFVLQTAANGDVVAHVLRPDGTLAAAYDEDGLRPTGWLSREPAA
jgi:hypothetical protein